MKNTFVYDFPTRIFHWLFAGLFTFAFAVAKLTDSHSVLFTFHMLAGLTLAFVLLWRIVWGFAGTKYARFNSFSLSPSATVGYFKGILTGDKTRWAGHNPASSWAALLMMACALGLVVSGLGMTWGGNEEAFEDVHEIFGDVFVVIAIFHVVGVILHTIRHRDPIGLSMIHGRKTGVDLAESIKNSHLTAGLVFTVLTAVFVVYLAKSFDMNTKSLKIFGAEIQLGESEHEGSHSEDHDYDDD